MKNILNRHKRDFILLISPEVREKNVLGATTG